MKLSEWEARHRAREPFWNHQTVSYVKSVARIIACVFSTLMSSWPAAVLVLALGLAGAECLGIWEEMGGRG
jgi:hypothetical protein